MALAVTFDGINITTADSVTGWDAETVTAPEAWTIEVLHQGDASIGFQSSRKDGMGYYTYGTALNFNTTYLGQHVFMWVNVTMPGTVEAISTGGLYIVIGSSSTNYKKFLIAAKDYKEVMEKGFARFVIDPSKTATETVGTPDMTAITVFGVWIDTDEAARIDQLFIDRIDVGWGLKVTGTSTSFWNDLVTGDIGLNAGVRDNMFGICQKYNDVFYLYGSLEIGDDTGTLATTVSDSGKTIKFVSQQYHNGTAWVDMVADDFFKINLVDNATNPTQFTDGVAVGTDSGRSGSSIAGSLLHDSAFNSNAMTNASSFIKLYATQITNMRSGILYHSDTDSLFYAGSIGTSGQFNPGIAVIRNIIIAETTDLDSSVLWNSSINIEKCTFIANTLGAAIQFPNGSSTTINFTALFFSGNTYDVLNSHTATITVSKLSLSDPSTYEGTLTLFTANFSHVLEGLEFESEVTYVTADTTTVLFHLETATVGDGSGKYKSTYTHSGGASVDILIQHVLYQPDISNIYGLTLPSADANVKVQMFTDDNYYNP